MKNPKRHRGDRARAEYVRRQHQEEALDDALKNTFPASDPVSIGQPTASSDDLDSVKSSSTESSDEREAFWAVVYKVRFGGWHSALSDQTTFEVKGKRLTIRQVCELVQHVTDELPYLVASELVKAMHGNHRLIQLFAISRTYATGSQCLLELLEEHRAAVR